MALEAVLKLHEEGYPFVLDADIQGFFDNLSHDVSMQAVAETVADGNILRRVEKFLTSSPEAWLRGCKQGAVLQG
jgi:retron-type reverse transcriptase